MTKKKYLLLLLFTISIVCVSLCLSLNNKMKLIDAIELNDIQTVERILIENPESVNELPYSFPHFINVVFENKNIYPLQVACDLGYFDIVQVLVESGADINSVDPYMRRNALATTLLSNSSNRYEIAMYLIENGAEIDFTSPVGNYRNAIENSLVIKLTDNGKTRTDSKLLYDYLFMNIDYEIVDWNYVYYSASYYNHRFAIEDLLQNGLVDIDHTFANDESALIVAVKRENYAVITFLIEKEIDITIEDSSGKTAIDYSVVSEDKEIRDLFE